MAADDIKNFAYADVNGKYNATDTAILLSSDTAARLPTAPFNAIWYNYTDFKDYYEDPNREIVRVTDVTGLTATVTRGQESVTATVKNKGGQYRLLAVPTARTFESDLESNLGAAYATSLRLKTPLVTAGAGTVTVEEYGDGRDVTTILTLTNFIVGALAGAAASLGIGNKVCSFPAGVHVFQVSYINLGFTCAGTSKTPKVGLGSVIASGAVAVLSGTATFMDYLTQQTATDSAGTAAPFGPLAPTAGAFAGIALNTAALIKDIFLNAAVAWAADNTGNLTATGTIVLRWTKLA